MILEAKQEGEGLKILTPNQMLKRLLIALAQIKAGNNSESLLNEIRQIAYSLYLFKISAPTWNEEFELPDGSYSISDIQDYFEYILQKHSESLHNPSIRIYVNRIENRITFKITKNKNGENVAHLEVVELVLVHCNLVNNDYQQDSRILYTFVPNKTFGSLLEISPTNHVFLKTFNSEFQEIKIWFTDQTSLPLEAEDTINATLIIK